MSCYFVYGTLGAGKGIFLARKMQEYLARGSRVATNVDLFPENLCPNTTESISRIPSLFRLEDLDQLGRGCPDEEKEHLGGLFLDEGAIWLNARDWNAKGRRELIYKLLMIRKLGWDIYIAVQDPESTDKQALGSLGENFICCSRLDYFRIPVISPAYDFYRLVKTRGKEQTSKILPHINKASYRVGKSKNIKPTHSETYRPKEYFGTYDTNQIFEIEQELYNERLIDMRAPFSYIPGKTLKEWYAPEPELEKAQEPPMTIFGIPNIWKRTVVGQEPKTKKPWVSIVLTALFAFFAITLWSIVLSDSSEAQTVDGAASASESAQQTGNPNENTKPLAPPVPDYLQGVYISGYLALKDSKGNITYDYAMHDRYHRSFDTLHYAVSVTPAAPCLAWLTTHDNISIKVTCELEPEPQRAQASGSLNNFDLIDGAKKAMEAI